MHQFFELIKLGLYLDKTLNFNLHSQEKMSKAIKKTGIIEKLVKSFLRHSLVTIDNTLARLHLNYVDLINDQSSNESFS